MNEFIITGTKIDGSLMVVLIQTRKSLLESIRATREFYNLVKHCQEHYLTPIREFDRHDPDLKQAYEFAANNNQLLTVIL